MLTFLIIWFICLGVLLPLSVDKSDVVYYFVLLLIPLVVWSIGYANL